MNDTSTRPAAKVPKDNGPAHPAAAEVAGECERDAAAVAAVAVIDQTSKEPSGVSIISAGTGGWQESVLAL